MYDEKHYDYMKEVMPGRYSLTIIKNVLRQILQDFLYLKER